VQTSNLSLYWQFELNYSPIIASYLISNEIQLIQSFKLRIWAYTENLNLIAHLLLLPIRLLTKFNRYKARRNERDQNVAMMSVTNTHWQPTTVPIYESMLPSSMKYVDLWTCRVAKTAFLNELKRFLQISRKRKRRRQILSGKISPTPPCLEIG
jgi:hypothetical protein